MDKLYSPATSQKIIAKYGFNISKSLGQNFLIDGNIVDSIIRGAQIKEGDLVIEVGPGLGVLTSAAACRARKVIGIEIDKKLIPVLNETLEGYDNVQIVNEDFLKLDMAELIAKAEIQNMGEFSGVKLIGNLPYYITSPIIMKVLEETADKPAKIQSLTVMVQKEVGERIKSGPGSKAYGALSVAVQYYCRVSVIAAVPKTVFIPKPKVDSIVLSLQLREKPPIDVTDPSMFFSVVRSAFGQRRKTLANSLTGLNGMQKMQVMDALDAAGIDAARRAETLDLSEFAAIANNFKLNIGNG